MCGQPSSVSPLTGGRGRLAKPAAGWYTVGLAPPGDFCLMAKVCDKCGRGPQFGNKVSHAHNITKRRWNINLKEVRAVVSGGTKRIRVCTSCIKNGKVLKAA